MKLFSVALAVLVYTAQNVYVPADFVRVSGASLKARYDNAVNEGRRGDTDVFWIAYQFPVRAGVRIDSWHERINISRSRSSDGIEFIDDSGAAQRIGLFLLVGKSDSRIQKSRILNLDDQFRIHDRKVFWLGEPPARESVALIASLAEAGDEQSSSTLLMTLGLHPEPFAAESLLTLARLKTASTQLKKNAVFWLSQEISRQAGDELEVIAASDPEVEVQKQAVFAISRRNDAESINSLIRISKEHPNLAVRKQAIFWLGQNKDPRVLDFYEQMLKK